MRISELKKSKMAINNLNEFKKVVEESVEANCYWKEFGYWLHDEYDESVICGDTCYSAKVIVKKIGCKDDGEYIQDGYNKIVGLTIIDIFYTTASNGFIIDETNLYYDALLAIKNLGS